MWHLVGAQTRRWQQTGRVPCFVGPSHSFAGSVTTTPAAGRTDALTHRRSRGTPSCLIRGGGRAVLFFLFLFYRLNPPPPPPIEVPSPTLAASSLYPKEFHFPKVVWHKILAVATPLSLEFQQSGQNSLCLVPHTVFMSTTGCLRSTDKRRMIML